MGTRFGERLSLEVGVTLSFSHSVLSEPSQ